MFELICGISLLSELKSFKNQDMMWSELYLKTDSQLGVGQMDFFKLYLLLSHRPRPSNCSQLVLCRQFTLESHAWVGWGCGVQECRIMYSKFKFLISDLQISIWEVSSGIHIFFRFPREFLRVHAVVWESFLLRKSYLHYSMFGFSQKHTV